MLKKISLSFPLILLLLAFCSCSKPSDLGLSLVETDPLDIVFTDSVSLAFSTVETNPAPSDNRSRWLCGYYLDPIFGPSSAGLYLNFRLSTTNAEFPNARFDSLVLTLQYDSIGHYGAAFDQFGPQSWEVYRLSELMEPDKTYNSDKDFSLGQLVAQIQFTPQIYDSVLVQGAYKKPHLRIRLDDDLGRDLLDPDSAIYVNNTIFKNHLKGFYIKPKENSGNNGILRFFPSSSMTRLTLFYTDSSGIAKTYDYINDSDAESVLRFDHQYQNTRVLLNSTFDTVSYMQGMNGAAVKIEFPDLLNLGKMVVNKAELIVYVAGEDDRNYKTPNQIFALQKNSSGELSIIDDVSNSITRSPLSPYQIFGGTLSNEGDKRFFRLNISKYLQLLVDGKLNENALYLQTAAITDSNRMLLANQKSSSLQAKLYLTYTKVQ
jgi:hypothetical protein